METLMNWLCRMPELFAWIIVLCLALIIFIFGYLIGAIASYDYSRNHQRDTSKDNNER